MTSASHRLGATDDVASWAMYPFPGLRSAWERLYRSVAGRVPGAPLDLRWDLEPRVTWLDPRLAAGMACGWPLVTDLRHRLQVIGTFAHRLDERESGHTYRSVVVASEPTTLLALRGRTFAFNSVDSLSGWVSMIALLGDDETTWPGPTVETGSHLASIEAVRSGSADVACIDAVTWAFVRRDAPELARGLAVIARGPEVPHLPLVTRADAGNVEVDAWRSALAHAVADPALADTCDTLLITGFVPLGAEVYEGALAHLRDRLSPDAPDQRSLQRRSAS